MFPVDHYVDDLSRKANTYSYTFTWTLMPINVVTGMFIGRLKGHNEVLNGD